MLTEWSVSMIKYIEGDMFSTPAQTIVNPVNTVGVMGKGLALDFKKRYPEMFNRYKKICEMKQLTTGKLMLYYAPDHWILLFPTKEHWRNPSKLEYIENGLAAFVKKYSDKDIQSIAFPKLGCGNGELNWEDVKPIMEKYLSNLNIDVYIYTGIGKETIPEHKVQSEMTRWLRSNAKDMSFRGVIDDIKFQSKMVPIEFNYKNDTAEAYYTDKLYLSVGLQQFTAEYDRLYEIWDNIRKNEIFKESENDDENMFYYLLLKLGYISRVAIINNKDNAKKEWGFQINSGLGRAFALKEF